MSESTPPAADPGESPSGAIRQTAARHPWWAYGALAVLLAALLFGAWGVWTVASGGAGGGSSSAGHRVELERLEQEVATLKRSDQISRDANAELQASLAARDEEIAGLRSDVAFYERFVGATAQPRGLAVHELELRPQQADGQVWHFIATLTQTRDRDAPSAGRLTLSVEGTQDGRLQRLSWADLRQQPDANGSEYSFRYFQRVEGDIILPPGFVPLRIHTRLAPSSGAPIERTIPWAEAARVAVDG
ncbi:DUF6776 family protein [Luteimonas aestuarii]|uniref:DUF6776 family protein n=1 Tax=Luteimonas aestuarii TaxID=453837 RepID=UPI001FB62E82|nr:DUF6776 family protein [Luteimonas aestuarii]